MRRAWARARIANYRYHRMSCEFSDRHATEHLERLRQGIKDMPRS
jgi:hypothetical protein